MKKRSCGSAYPYRAVRWHLHESRKSIGVILPSRKRPYGMGDDGFLEAGIIWAKIEPSADLAFDGHRAVMCVHD